MWNFRWEHAQARIAVRRGRKAEAQQHVTASKAILDKDPDMARQQAVFFPYLTGYVALYTGDAKTAIPFGPFLAAGALLALFLGHALISAYLGLVFPAR